MIELTLLLLAAAVGYAASRWTGLPAIPLLIAGGVGASALITLEMSFLGDVLTLGVIVLVFVAGIELNPARLRGRGWAALRVGFFQFVALGSLGLACIVLLGFDLQAAAYLALALSASSTLVVVKVLQERQLLFEPVGRLVTGVLLLQDLLIILLIPVVNRLPEGWAAIAEGVLATFALMALTGVLVRWVTPRVLDRFDFDEESLLLVTLSVLFGFLGIANLLGIPLVSGAFLAGVVLSGFPAAALVRGQLNSMGDFFHALFFTALGAFLPLPTMGEVGLALALLLLVVVVTPPLVAFVAERSGFSARAAVLSGLLLSQTSEFSLVVALQGVLVGHLDSSVFTVITLVTVATMILTPFLASDRVVWKLLAIHPLRRSSELQDRSNGHVLLLGCGRHGQALLEALIVTREDLVVVDDDPAVVDRLREAGVTALRGDISDTDVLRAVGADRARVVISTIRRREDNAPLLDLAKDVFVMVRGFNLEDGRWISERGGQPVLYSEAAAHDFRDWYEHEWQAVARE